jgi:hypothetical protein
VIGLDNAQAINFGVDAALGDNAAVFAFPMQADFSAA